MRGKAGARGSGRRDTVCNGGSTDLLMRRRRRDELRDARVELVGECVPRLAAELGRPLGEVPARHAKTTLSAARRRAFGRGRMRGSRAVRREAYDAATRTARARVSSDLELTSARTCAVRMARSEVRRCIGAASRDAPAEAPSAPPAGGAGSRHARRANKKSQVFSVCYDS